MAETVMNAIADEVMQDVLDETFQDLIDPENYASSAKVRRRVEEEVLSRLDEVRAQRREITERWNRLDRMHLGKRDSPTYDGELHKVYVAMGRKMVNTFVSQIITQIFPHTSLFLMESTNPADQEAMVTKAKISSLIKHDVEQDKLKTKMPLYLSEGFVKGPSIFKVQWKTKTSRNYSRVKVGDTFSYEKREIKLYEGPSTDVVDLYRWYIDPITSRSIEDARMIFEDISHTKGWLRSQSRLDQKRVKKLLKEGSASARSTSSRDMDSDREARVNSDGFSIADACKKNNYRVTEIWVKFDLYGDGQEVPCRITVVGDHILEIRQNPFLHQMPPYLAWRVYDRIDNFYGMGLLESIESLQYTFNALINQGLDNSTWQSQPMMLVNRPMLSSNPQDLKIAPRKIIYTHHDPGQVIHFERPPQTFQINFEVAQLVAGILQDIVGAPPALQGKVGDNDQTATEADILARNAGAFTNILAAKLEADVLSPMLQMMWQLEQQFRREDTHLMITGQPKEVIAPQEIVGDYKFTWSVSTGAVERMQIRQAEGGMTAAPGAPTAQEQGAAIPPNLQGMG